jgi:hypothetical protein
MLATRENILYFSAVLLLVYSTGMVVGLVHICKYYIFLTSDGFHSCIKYHLPKHVTYKFTMLQLTVYNV